MMIRLIIAFLLNCLIAVVFVVAAEANQTLANSNNGTAKIQARILLQTNNLDLEDKLLENISNHHQISAENSTIVKKRKVKKERSNRRLSNIWSMFLPGSSSSNDYDYELEDADKESEGDAAQNKNNETLPVSLKSDTQLVERLGSTQSKNEKHDEKLVEKYSRPPRQDGSSEFLLTSGSSGQITRSAAAAQDPPATTNTTTRPEQPVQLITGSLMSKDTISPSMNDIVSNIMNSMNDNNKSSEIEREDEPVESKNRTENGSFERWLNRIQFQDPTSTTTTSSPIHRILSTKAPPTARQALNETHKKAPQTDVVRMVEALNELRLRQQQQHRQLQHQLKYPQFRIHPQAHPSKLGAIKAHPHRQKLAVPEIQQQKQQKLQLIHGIKYPSAQASTISVSTQDGSLPSNTSLSFANNFAFLNNEMSQSVNSSANSASQSNPDENNIEQQSVYQSQDEILRQVTSAINFEQQLSQNKRAENHRKAGEPVGTINEGDAPENLSKMFKVGSSLNELMDSNRTAQASPGALLKASMENNSLNGTLGMDEIDRSFDMLAEKLRSFAAQQQQLASAGNSSGSSPSWLRKPQEADLKQLNALLSPQDEPFGGVEKVRELLEKHERSKNELKSSQENMALLVQRLIQPDEKFAKPEHKQHQIQQRQQQQPSNLVRGGESVAPEVELGQLGGNLVTEQKASIGQWTPVKPQLQLNAPPSPANLMKLRFKQPISQLNDNVGVGKDYANDDYYMNNLALMFASSAGAAPEENEPKIIGMPIAILKEEEEELESPEAQAQLEAAVEQLKLANQNRFHPSHQFAARQTAQQAPRSSEPNQPQLNQIQRLLQSYSPQTFGQATRDFAAMNLLDKQRVAPARMNNNLASLDNAEHNQLEQANLFSNQFHNEAAVAEPANRLVGSPSNGEQSSSTAEKSPLEPAAKYQQQQRLNINQQQQNNEEFKLQRQAQQHQQQQVIAPVNLIQPNYNMPMSGYPMRPANYLPDMNPYSRAPFVTTAITNEGPPVRVREVSLFKPFGFRTHHAIAYQASPTMAAMFPALNQPPRPSILRHMTPFKAAFHDNARTLAPFIPPQFLLDNQQRQPALGYQSSSHLGAPILHHQHYVRFGANGNIRRHSAPQAKDSWINGAPSSNNKLGRGRELSFDQTVVESTLKDNPFESELEEVNYRPNELVKLEEEEEEEGANRARQHVRLADTNKKLPASSYRQQRNNQQLLNELNPTNMEASHCSNFSPREKPSNSSSTESATQMGSTSSQQQSNSSTTAPNNLVTTPKSISQSSV